MLNYIWAFMLLVGIIYGAWSGNISEVSTAVLDSSVQAVELEKNIIGECNLLRPILNIRPELNLNRRVCNSLAVKHSVLIYCLIKMVSIQG
jgi:spore maturation protein A